MIKDSLFLGLFFILLLVITKQTTANNSSDLPIDSVSLSPDYYDKTYILNYMDISVFFAKDIDSIDGKFYMAPEGVSIASTPEYAHDPSTNYFYRFRKSNYLYYCDEVELRNKNELFIPYRNYFSDYDHHLKYDCKYKLLFVGEISFSDGSEFVNTESDVLAEFITAPVPANRLKDEGTFTFSDIANIGFSRDHLEDPTSDRYIKATYGKTAIHNLPPVTAENITGKDINVAIVDLQIYQNTLVDKAVVFRSHPVEDELFIEKEKIALLSQNLDSILPLYNHGTQMARYMLNYSPGINIYNYNKYGSNNIFPYLDVPVSILDPINNIDIASFSGSSLIIEDLVEGIHDGLIVCRSLGNDRDVFNTFDDAKYQDLFLPHFSPYLTGDNRETMTGAFVTLQGVLFNLSRPGGPGDFDINTAYSIRSGAGDAKEYTLSITENGNGATSEATATFSGMVALMLEANKKYESQYTPREVVEIMFQTAIDIGPIGVDSIFGWGVPDLGAALKHIKNKKPVTFVLYGVNEYNTIPLVAEVIDSVSLSPDYYIDKTYLLNYMDISVFFAKDIDSIEGKFFMAPEGITLADLPDYIPNITTNGNYKHGNTSYLFYCDEVEIRNQNEVYIPYRNYFSEYNHHLKFDCKYHLLFVGEISFTDGSTYVNTESDFLSEFNTPPITDYRMKEKSTFAPADIANIGFSKAHLEDPTSDRYIQATYGKTEIHNLPPVTAEDITGNDINVAIIDLQIYQNTLVNKAVVFRSHPLEDEMFIEKDEIALLSQDIESILPLYNHGTQMARYMLNYAPEINIFNYNKLAEMDNVFPDSLFAASIMDPVNEIDIASFSGNSTAIEALAEAVHDGLIISRSLGNDITVTNTFGDTKSPDLFLPHNSPYLTGGNRESMSGAFVTLQGVLFDCFISPAEELICGSARSVRSGAGDAQEYTLSIIENGNGATSEATATFSGMVALMLEANKNYESQYTPREVIEIMFQTAIDIGPIGVDSIFGWGVPDLGAALEHIKNKKPVTFDLYGVNEPTTPLLAELPIDSVCLSPDYYTDKTYILNYMDISVFFAKDIDTINGKFYMAPEGVSIASTPEYAHDPSTNYGYRFRKSNYLYYCDEVELRNKNELFIPYRNYFSDYDHHLKYDCKYKLLFVGEISFSDGSEFVNTESDVLAEFITAPIPANRLKDEGTFTFSDIANIGFSRDHLEDPASDRYIYATYGKTAIHNLPPVTAENITGKDINVAIVDLQIYQNTLVDKAVVFKSHPVEDEMFIEKEKIALLSQNRDSILPLYNHGTQMARYMLNYSPGINIYNYNKYGSNNIFPYLDVPVSIMDPVNEIDIASFSGSSSAIEELAEGIQKGLIVSRSLGNDQSISNTFDDALYQDLFLPHFSPYLTGDNRESMTGAFVTLQGALFNLSSPGGPADFDLNTAYSVRSGAGEAREYTLSIIENGNGATSEATATFSGMVALMLEANKNYESQYTPREVIEIMFQTAIDIGPIGVDSIFGWGVPDLGAALKHIKNKKPVTFDLYGVNVSSSISLFSDNILDIKVFPNPVSEVLSIDLNSNNKDLNHIKLFNLSGKECLVEVINPNTKYIDLDLNALPNGVYMLHFCLANGATSSRKIIKK